jgi:GAF domain-containing protein
VSAIEVILVAIAAWTTLSVAIVLMMRPLLHMARLGELAPARPRPEAPRPAGESFSLLRESGYLGIVLERLVLHASTTFGADQVCVFGRDTRAGRDGLVLVQGAGVNPDLIGRPLDVDWDPLVAALACGRPLAVPGRLWPAWDAGHPPAGEVLSAAIAPIWFGGRVQGAVSLTRMREGDGFDVNALGRLGELAELPDRRSPTPSPASSQQATLSERSTA